MSRSLKAKIADTLHREVVTEAGIFRIRRIASGDLLEHSGALAIYAPAADGKAAPEITPDKLRAAREAMDSLCCAGVVAYCPQDGAPWEPCTLTLEYADVLPDPLVWVGGLDDGIRDILASEVMDLSTPEAMKRKVAAFREGQGADPDGGSDRETVRPDAA